MLFWKISKDGEILNIVNTDAVSGSKVWLTISYLQNDGILAIIFSCLKYPALPEQIFPYGTSAKLSENGRFALIAD